MTQDEAFRQYEEALAKLDEQSCEAHKEARATLREQLEAIRKGEDNESGASGNNL